MSSPYTDEGRDLNPRSEDLYGGDAKLSKDNSSLRVFTFDMLAPFAFKPSEKVLKSTQYVFKSCVRQTELCNPSPKGELHIQGIPRALVNMITKDNLQVLAKALNVKCSQRTSISTLREDIIKVIPFNTVWNLVFAHKSVKASKPTMGKKPQLPKIQPFFPSMPVPAPLDHKNETDKDIPFPPPPASKELLEKITNTELVRFRYFVGTRNQLQWHCICCVSHA